MLWVDKYRPVKIDDLSYNDDVTERIRCMTDRPLTVPHLLLYGPSGCGKKTRIRVLVRQLFGPSAISKLKLEKRTFTISTGSSSKAIDINMISSPYHIEISPSDAGINDRHIIQDVIKEMASTKNVVSNMVSSLTSSSSSTAVPGTTSTSTTSNTLGSKPQYKVVVLLDVDLLTKQAQAALRRTMEKYTTTCRLILCCSNSSKVMEAVRSRCLSIRIPSPTHDNIAVVLKTICQKEGISSTIINDEIRYSIASESSRNIRRAILMMEAYHVQHRNSTTTQQQQGSGTVITVPKPDWELYIVQLATDITNEQSPQRLVAAREKLYELIINCIPPTIILKTLVRELLTNLDDGIKSEIIYWAAFYEHRIALGSKEIFHLEAFIAKYMSIYKQYLNDLFG